MLDEQIQALGSLTQKKIAESSESLRAEIAGQGEHVENRFAAILASVKSQVDALGREFTERLNGEVENRRDLGIAGHELRAELDARIKDNEARVEKTLELLTKELEELDTCFADRLHDALEKQRMVHALEIDGITAQIREREDIEAKLAERIATIKDGEDGEQGPIGFQGPPGEDGQDRPLLQPVELSERDYEKNTLGTYDGALWISTKHAMGTPESDPHAWHCILDAIKDVRMDLEQDGTFKLSVRMATGRRRDFPLEIPYPEHCGIWEEREYRKGQIVTKGNSMWQAMENTAGTPPGNGWRQILSAPRGKAGAPGKSIEGPQGKPGRNGRDVDPAVVAELRQLIDKARAIVGGVS